MGGVLIGGLDFSAGIPESDALELLSSEALGGQAGGVGFAKAAGPALPSLAFSESGVFFFGGVTNGLGTGF